MAGYETNVKLNVDTTELDEVIEKTEQLKDTLLVVRGLIKELTGLSNVDTPLEITMESKELKAD